MVTPAAAAVVLIPFPFSDMSQSKMRPAIALANAGRNDWVLCQVTSNRYGDPRAIGISQEDFLSGSLDAQSYARPGKLFTANASLIVTCVGVFQPHKFRIIIEAVVSLLRSGANSQP